MMTDKALEPKIRFENFSDAWECRLFNSFAVRRTKVVNIHNLPRIEYEDIIPEQGQLNDKYALKNNLKKGILFETSDVLYGKLRPYLKNWFYAKFAGIAVGDFWVLRAINIDAYFLYLIIQNSEYQKIANISSGSKMPRSDWGIVSQSKFAIPANAIEQSRISAFFRELDKLITKQEKKVEKLRKLKKAFLGKMFPQQGEQQPKIRFNGFTDDWKEHELGAISGEFKSGEYISAYSINEGEYPVYGGNGLRGYTSIYNRDGEYALIGRQGALCGNMNYTAGKAYITEHAIAVCANESNYTRFCFYLLYIMELGQYSGQTAQPGLAVKDLTKLVSLFPIKQEQTRIGTFFKTLDHLISLQDEKLAKLKNLKKAFLDKMFA